MVKSLVRVLGSAASSLPLEWNVAHFQSNRKGAATFQAMETVANKKYVGLSQHSQKWQINKSLNLFANMIIKMDPNK